MANALKPVSLDPAKSNPGDSLPYLWLAYDSLIRVAPDGSFQPGLATKWSYSDGNKTFEISIRPGLKFSDGTPLDAAAVKANFDRDMTVNGPVKSTWSAVGSTDVVDNTTVRVHLKSAMPSLPTALSQNFGMMVSPAAFGKPDLDQNPVGAGPYMLDASSTISGDHYTYVPNPNYFDQNAVKYTKITMRVIADYTAMFQAVQAGNATAGKGNPDTATTAKKARLDVLSQPTDSTGLMLYDRTGALVPALGDVRVRQALNYAIDRQKIVESILSGYGTATSQFISKGMEGYDSSLDKAYPYDPAKARELLAAAGYANGFTLPILSRATDATVVQAVADYFAKVGVKVEIVTASPAGLASDTVAGGHAAAWQPWGMSSTYLDMQTLLGKDSPRNPEHTVDEQMIKLLNEGASQADQERNATFQKLSKRMTDEAWFVPVFTADAIVLVAPNKIANPSLTPHVIMPNIIGWQPA
ncbi:ABC transporter substrate-binding protein [Dactylosporangium sp. NPDC051484]|uniref:ABC transporter substrate-binding protein n=1 Tax=Dactylosporangium sp. NPDC051484 TaxID=3154942 RepID=UPI003450CB7A